MYRWRKMTEEERRETMESRHASWRPWHSPPHYHSEFTNRYLFTAACLNHEEHIGRSPTRLTQFESALLETAGETCEEVTAWVILPNHYHFLATSEHALVVLSALGKLHGKSSFQWNGEENKRGRQIWHNAAESAIKSDGHYWATVNYLHHNPVKHGYVSHWQDWPWSSASRYLESAGREEAERIWKRYPIDQYGNGWDD